MTIIWGKCIGQFVVRPVIFMPFFSFPTVALISGIISVLISVFYLALLTTRRSENTTWSYRLWALSYGLGAFVLVFQLLPYINGVSLPAANDFFYLSRVTAFWLGVMAFYRKSDIPLSFSILPVWMAAWIALAQAAGWSDLWREVPVYFGCVAMYWASAWRMWHLNQDGSNWGFYILAIMMFAHGLNTGGYPFTHQTWYSPYGFTFVALISPAIGMGLMLTALIGEQRELLNEIKAREIAEAEQRKSFSMIETLLAYSPAGISVFDGETGKCMLANQALADMAGGTVEALQRQNFREIKSWREVGLDAQAEAVLADSDTRFFETTLHTSFGKVLPLECLVSRFDVDEKPYLLFTASDVTERKKAAEHIAFLANHDALTQLPNHSLLRDSLTQAIALADRLHTQVALLQLDLDNFKTINELFGHTVGDELLKEVAQRLGECVHDANVLARQGGDEFLIMMPDLRGAVAVTSMAEKILERLAEPFFIEEHELAISVSIGVALHPEDGNTFDTLLKNADTAMYQAKQAGRNTYRFFDARMNEGTDERLQLRNNLRQALELAELELYYQPQIDLSTGNVIGAEALIRWNHAGLGMIPPGRFISIAEDSGLIVPIGNWVLREACEQAITWQRAGLPRLVVAVNLSAVQFKRGDIEQTVLSALGCSGLSPRCLELELTESMLIDDPESVLQTVRRLQALGVGVSIDDFGTGYSNLAYLKRFAVNKVKIDQSFIRDINTDPNDAAIVRAIVQMADSLGLKTIAEGVENEQQLEFLQKCGCNAVQGFYFARPMSADQFVTYCFNEHSNSRAIKTA